MELPENINIVYQQFKLDNEEQLTNTDISNKYVFIINQNLDTEESPEQNSQNIYLYNESDSNIYMQDSSVSENIVLHEPETTKNLYQPVQLVDGTQVLCKFINEDFIEGIQLQNGQQNYEVAINDDQNHVLINGRKYFVCEVSGCNKHYASKSALKIHHKTHSGIKPFSCVICENKFNTSYALKTHIRVHTGDRPYKCRADKCAKSFKTSGDLNKHIRTHTGDRPFKCTVKECNMSFTTTTVRKVHMRTHTGERPFTCSYKDCNKSFINQTNLTNHERIHNGEKPYVCVICKRSFTEYSSLFKHKKVHLHNTEVTCPICDKKYKKMQPLILHMQKVHPLHEIEVKNIPGDTIFSSDEIEDDPQDKIDDQIFIIDSSIEESSL